MHYIDIFESWLVNLNFLSQLFVSMWIIFPLAFLAAKLLIKIINIMMPTEKMENLFQVNDE